MAKRGLPKEADLAVISLPKDGTEVEVGRKYQKMSQPRYGSPCHQFFTTTITNLQPTIFQVPWEF